MAYIGKQLVAGNYLKLDDISSQFNSSTTTFNLTSGGTAFYPGSAYSILVSLGGIVQEPIKAYTINLNQITFAGAPPNGTSFFCIVLGNALGVGVPADGTVSGSKLSSPFNYNSGLLYLDTVNTRVGIATTTPQAPLHVVGTGNTTLLVSGNARITGILTIGTGSVTIDGNANTITGVSTISSPSISGVATFTTGPVLIGSATSTGTVLQRLQVTGGASFTGTGSSVGIGTTNPQAPLHVVGTGQTALLVSGNARITGILTVGTGSITFDGNANTVTGISTITGSSNFSKPNLSGISSVTSDNAVKVFVYDTRKDSDGGAWRKRTQNTSWYNETLNTATRGSRRDFPAVAVIVATSDNLTIYDGDDPDMPMWMIFQTGSFTAINNNNPTYSLTSTSMLNGILCVASYNGSTTGGLAIINFISDTCYRSHQSTSTYAGYYFRGTKISPGILNRNDGNTGFNGQLGKYSDWIVNSTANDVAMTVLPNAPIDSATGLPVPTIAVATDGGASVIKDDGNVYDDTDTAPLGSVDFNDDYRIISTRKGTGSAAARFFISKRIDTVNSDSSWLYEYYTGNYASPGYPRLRSEDTGAGITLGLKGDTCIRASNIGITLWDVNSSQIGVNNYSTNSLLCGVSTSFNTGWMHGDIKGAFLSDTSTTSVSAPTPIFSDTFTTDAGWSLVQCTISGGTLNLNSGSSSRATWGNIGGSSGTKYNLTFTITSNPGNYTLSPDDDGIGAGLAGVTQYASVSGTGTFSVLITRTASTRIRFIINATTTQTLSIDNVYIYPLNEADRSVNNNGLTVFGTVTKTAVATGADLVGYSGFSGSNYFQQPQNTALDFGTGDFSIMFWGIMVPSTGTYRAFQINHVAGSTDLFMDGIGLAITIGGNNKLYQNTSSNNIGWSHQVLVRRSGVLYYYSNARLITSTASTESLVTNSSSTLKIGEGFNQSLALFRISSSSPSPDQITKIYNDEKALFQQNSKATLYGSSSAVTALAYDDSTRLLYAGTSSGRSDFQGLQRINNTTTAVTTAISASNGLIAEQ